MEHGSQCVAQRESVARMQSRQKVQWSPHPSKSTKQRCSLVVTKGCSVDAEVSIQVGLPPAAVPVLPSLLPYISQDLRRKSFHN
jgi:hypothetical protein